jgi:hypothetical protein
LILQTKHPSHRARYAFPAPESVFISISAPSSPVIDLPH